MPIKDQSLLYHLTDINNLPLILQHGLLSRSQLSTFSDIADQEIISSRRILGLENYVPFHFFAKSPFDGIVQKSNTDKTFILITVQRNLAKTKNWVIIPQHPLSMETAQIMDYSSGIEAIDWEAMELRDYANQHSSNVCMAECLSPDTVHPSLFFSIFVKDSSSHKQVMQLITQYGLTCHVNVNPKMFIS